jgi:hypothetical protein
LADGGEPGDRPPAIPVDGAVLPPADDPDPEAFGTRPPTTGVRELEDFGDGST